MALEQAVGTAEMALAVGCSADKLRAMADAGEVPHMRIGRKYTFTPSRVRAALEKSAAASAPKPQPAEEGGAEVIDFAMSRRSRAARRRVA